MKAMVTLTTCLGLALSPTVLAGQIAELMGRRMACRLDNARLPESQRHDCIAELPAPQ